MIRKSTIWERYIYDTILCAGEIIWYKRGARTDDVKQRNQQVKKYYAII